MNAAKFSTHDEPFDTTGAKATGAAADVALLIAGLATITDGHVGDIYNKINDTDDHLNHTEYSFNKKSTSSTLEIGSLKL